MSALVHKQVSFTFYFHPARLWRKQRAFVYLFSCRGMWEFCIRVLWFGIDVHNNSVWAAEDEVVLKDKQRRLIEARSGAAEAIFKDKLETYSGGPFFFLDSKTDKVMLRDPSGENREAIIEVQDPSATQIAALRLCKALADAAKRAADGEKPVRVLKLKIGGKQ